MIEVRPIPANAAVFNNIETDDLSVSVERLDIHFGSDVRRLPAASQSGSPLSLWRRVPSSESRYVSLTMEAASAACTRQEVRFNPMACTDVSRVCFSKCLSKGMCPARS